MCRLPGNQPADNPRQPETSPCSSVERTLPPSGRQRGVFGDWNLGHTWTLPTFPVKKSAGFSACVFHSRIPNGIWLYLNRKPICNSVPNRTKVRSSALPSKFAVTTTCNVVTGGQWAERNWGVLKESLVDSSPSLRERGQGMQTVPSNRSTSFCSLETVLSASVARFSACQGGITIISYSAMLFKLSFFKRFQMTASLFYDLPRLIIQI